MAKIQLVIEIEERLYKNIIDNDMDDEEFEAIDIAFWNAKPLPKGHGGLVDFDRLCEEYWDGNYMEIYKDDLPNIKPIIEADGGGEDDE